MLTATVLVVCALALVSVATPTDKPYYDLEQAEQHFEQFMRTHGKTYADEQEKRKRFEIFKQRLNQVNELNARSEYAVYGYTRYTDIAADEIFKPYPPSRRNYPSSMIKTFELRTHNASLPESFDWRKKNAITEVKDQMIYCESGWAFAVIGSLEGTYAHMHNELVEFSVQQLIDCDNLDHGCLGGNSFTGCMTLGQMGGAVTEKNYSYCGQQNDVCLFKKEEVKAIVRGAYIVNATQDDYLMYFVLIAPVAIGIDSTDIQQYKSGIVTKCSHNQTNHHILIVGYGAENGVPYWLIKNSWGKSWGEDGYFRLKRGINACGINKDSGYAPYVPNMLTF